MATVKSFPRHFLSGENGEKGFAGFVFIFLLFTFMIPMTLLNFNIGRNLIVKEGVMSAMDAAVLAGANETRRVNDAYGSAGQPVQWHYEIVEPQAIVSGNETFERNIAHLKLETNFNATILRPQPSFSFPDINQMSGSIPFKVGMEDFNKANAVLNPSLSPSPEWVATGNSRSVFSQPEFE